MNVKNIPLNIRKQIKEFIGYSGICKNFTKVYFFDYNNESFEGGYTYYLNPIKEGFRSKFVYVPYYKKFYTINSYNNLINNGHISNWKNRMINKY